ncbi:MAG: TMEM175 family protein [Solirubrobacteraceae bacterium]
MGTSRLESFSDGVMAVAITLLVLGISVPEPRAGASLGHELGTRWPEYAAYAVSFMTIGIIWINHHVMISRLREADHPILILNLLLLMSIGILPFATSLMATYLRQSQGQTLAAVIYAGSLLVMSVFFSLLNHTILIKKPHLLREPLSLEGRRRIFRRAFAGVIPYAVATPLGVVSPYLTIGICALIAAFYMLPIASGTERVTVT